MAWRRFDQWITDSIITESQLPVRKAIYILSPVPLLCFLTALYFNSGTYVEIFGYTGLTLSWIIVIFGFWFLRKEEKAGKKTVTLLLALLLSFSPHWIVMVAGIYQMSHSK